MSNSVTAAANFSVGQIGHRRLFDYRGVVVDLDATFAGSDEWYEGVARSRPPKDEPWYHVLVDGAEHSTYVAERNLEADESGRPIRHPAIDIFFDELRDGAYVSNAPSN